MFHLLQGQTNKDLKKNLDAFPSGMSVTSGKIWTCSHMLKEIEGLIKMKFKRYAAPDVTSVSRICVGTMTNKAHALFPSRQAWALVGVIDGGSTSCNESVRNYENHSSGGKALAQREFYTVDGQKFAVTAYSEWIEGKQEWFRLF